MDLLKSLLVGSVVATLAVSAARAENAPGVTDDEILIGNTTAYSGPAAAYSAVAKAISAYFDMINEKGGVNGRQLRFVTVDDGYSPPRTVEQVRKLVERDEVAFLFNTLGTPTNSAVHQYLNQREIPHLFVATGATKWGNPKEFPWTMGWQPAYQTEGRIFARFILQNHPDARIGVLYQNDDYGKDYFKGLRDGLGSKAETMIVGAESFEVTDPTVESQIVNLKASGANVFFDVTTAKHSAQAIRKVAEIGWKPVHLLNSVSASVGAVIEPAGFENSQGVISTAYLKDPTDPAWKGDPELKDWLAWIEEYYPEANKSDAFNVYGYAAASTMVQVLKQCGDDLSRENIMRQAASLKDFRAPMLLPNIRVTTGPNDFYPVEQMQLIRFEGDQWIRFGKIIEASLGGS